MQEHLGKILVGGLFLALLAGRIYFKKPGFTPAESCWRCLWRNARERWLMSLWRKIFSGVAIIGLGAALGAGACYALGIKWNWLNLAEKLLIPAPSHQPTIAPPTRG